MMKKDLPRLPRGLEYYRITRPHELCENCASLVAKGPKGVMIRQSSNRKKNRFLHYFPKEHGFCLKCSRKQLGRFISEKFSEASEAIAAADTLEMQGESAENQRLIIDGIQETIESLGNYLGNSSGVEQDLVHVGKEDVLGDMYNGPKKSSDSE